MACTWGDLGHVTGVSVVGLIGRRPDRRSPGRRGPQVLPALLFVSRLLPAPDIPGTTSKPKGAPRKYQNGPSSCVGTRSWEDGDWLDSGLAGMGDLSLPGSRRGPGRPCVGAG